jgi:diguanylate cyclase (GGDEF)-like protein
LDLDEFKKVNDALGHNRGDHLLSEFGKYMSEHFRRLGDTGRFGGDEFLQIIDLNSWENADNRDVGNPHTAKEYMQSVIANFVDGQPHEIKDTGFNVALGYVVREQGDHRDANQLIRDGDAAMYLDKQAHKEEVAAH